MFHRDLLADQWFKKRNQGWGCGVWLTGVRGLRQNAQDRKKTMRSDGRQKTVHKGRSLSECDRVLCYWLIGKCRLTLHKTVLLHNTMKIKKMDSVTHWLAVERHPQLLLIEASIQTTALKIGPCCLVKFSPMLVLIPSRSISKRKACMPKRISTKG